MIVNTRDLLLMVNVPEDGIQHIVTIIQDPDDCDVLLDGVLVDTTTGQTTERRPSSEAAEALARACETGTLENIIFAVNNYRAHTKPSRRPPQNTLPPSNLLPMKPVRGASSAGKISMAPIPPNTEPDPIPAPADPSILVPTEDELAEIARCICPRPGCPVHKTEAAPDTEE